jgi:hypothetical protein
VFGRTYFERLGQRIGGFPREEIMAFSEEPIPSGPVTLLPHQVELSDKLTEELLQNKVAWLGAPTQTGKTYTLMATLEKLGVERITWGVPTRAIKDSIVRNLSRLQIDNLRIGVVGSEQPSGRPTASPSATQPMPTSPHWRRGSGAAASGRPPYELRPARSSVSRRAETRWAATASFP